MELVGLLDRPAPHNLCFNLSCAVVPLPELVGGLGSPVPNLGGAG